MGDDTLLRLMIDLADRIRDLPDNNVADDIRQRCIAVIQHLQSTKVLQSGNWNLGAKR